MINRLVLASAAAVFSVAFAGAATAATVNLTTSADGIVQNTHGPVAAVSDLMTLNVVELGGSTYSAAIFEFDLSSIANTSSVTSAAFSFTLAQNVVSPSLPAMAFEVDAYLGDGLIDVSDFSTLGSQVIDDSILASFGGVPGAMAGDVLTFGLSSLLTVQNALAGDMLTLRVRPTSAFAFNQFSIAALENTTFGAASLRIETTAAQTSTVPLPAGLPLLLAGLGALAITRKRNS